MMKCSLRSYEGSQVGLSSSCPHRSLEGLNILGTLEWQNKAKTKCSWSEDVTAYRTVEGTFNITIKKHKKDVSSGSRRSEVLLC